MHRRGIEQRTSRGTAARLHDLPRRDGRATAGWAAREVKRNEQFDSADPAVAAIAHELKETILRHPLVQ